MFLKSASKRCRLKQVITYVALAIYVLIVAFPLFWMLITSIKSEQEIYSLESLWWPKRPTISNYSALTIRKESPFLTHYKNSLIVAFGATLLGTAVSVLGAYSIVRLRWWGQGLFSISILVSYLVPVSLLVIPLYIILRGFRLTNTLSGLILAYLTQSLPFCTWALMGYLKTLPREMEDAARVDGCSYLGTLFRIVIPLAAPAIMTVASFSFVLSWNLFFYPLVLISSASKQVLPVGLRLIVGSDVIIWGELMAAAILTLIVPIFLFILVQRYIITGLVTGAVKG